MMATVPCCPPVHSIVGIYFTRHGYATPPEIVPEGGFRRGNHPNCLKNIQEDVMAAITCTDTGAVVAAFSSQQAVAAELYGAEYKDADFASNVLNSSATREFHHNMKGPDGKPCNLSRCYLRRLSKEEASEHENLIQLSGEQKLEALRRAGKWTDDPKQVLVCGCGERKPSVNSIKTHVGRSKNAKCKEGYYEKLGIKAFSGKKYEFLRNKRNR